jgi:DNA polymerase-4
MLATILHADLDAFYASVEQLLDPLLRGKPIAVGGGVVLAASYEAKAFGVCGGMARRRAHELCPHLIFVDGHFNEYERLGEAAIKVIGDFTPLVERISIDEAFADVAGCSRLFGAPAEIAKKIRRRVQTELGLPISVGVARTKHLAKIASQVAKPDGLVVVDPEAELDFLHELPVELMWGGRTGCQSAIGRNWCAHHWSARTSQTRHSGALARSFDRREVSSTGVESRSTTNQDPSSIRISRSTVGYR